MTAAILALLALAAFSTASPGPGLPPGWQEVRVPNAPPPVFDIVRDENGTSVLRVASNGNAGAAAHTLRVPAAERPILSWRWKVDRVVAAADMASRAGDDFAARLYVFFDVPDEALPLGARVRIRLARWLHGAELPTAALCYVWDNRHPMGTSTWNPYTDRVRMVVVESGSANAGGWTSARRDLEADFRAAFGAQWKGPVPAITGIAVGNDTDQTGEAATAWFGDLRLEPRA